MHPETEIAADQAARRTAAGDYLLDVREQQEWDAGHAPHAAHIPMSELPRRTGELPADRTIICVCHFGSRSAMVTAALNRGGWQALNLTGGMDAWATAGLPVVTDDGDPGQIV